MHRYCIIVRIDFLLNNLINQLYTEAGLKNKIKESQDFSYIIILAKTI